MRDEKRVLENIHNLVTWHYGQNYLFNGCMQYLMECLGESQEYDYWFFSGVTGDSFTQVHSQDCKRLVSCLSQDAFDKGLAKKAFDACGYGFIYVDETELEKNRAKYVEKIIDYIDKGIPVITRGCEGTRSFSVICGYENNGKAFLYLKGDDKVPTLYENSLTDPSGHPSALVFVGEKMQAPPLADVYSEAVMSIPAYIAMAPKDGLIFGEQAFESWANSLQDGRFANRTHWVNSIQDGKFEDRNDAEIDVWRIHGTYLCIAGTNGCTVEFLKRAQTLCPDMEIIPRLLPIYENMRSIWKKIETQEGGFSIAPAKFNDKAAMQSLCDKIREFCRCCREINEVFASHQVSPKILHIETPHLVIRRWTATDWSGFQALTTDYNDTGGKYEGMWPTSEADCRKSVEFMADDGKFYAVSMRDTGQMVGMLTLNGMDNNGQMDFGYIFHTQFQDGLHDREASMAMLGHIFTTLKASSVVVRWQPEWVQQFVLPKALGFELVDGRRGEMRLTRSQWEQSV